MIDDAVRAFETVADELVLARPSDVELRKLCDEVASFTTEIFPGELAIKLGRDHELRNDAYLVFSVSTTGSPDEISARSRQWHLNLHRVAGKRAELFCLSFNVH